MVPIGNRARSTDIGESSCLTGAAWIRLRDDVLARDDHQCTNCGAEADLEVHHVIPLDRGGTNLLTVCWTCHDSAYGRSVRIADEEPDSDRVRWLPTIEDVRRLVRSTPHSLERAIVVLLAKTGIGVGEVCNLLLDDIALADADMREDARRTAPTVDRRNGPPSPRPRDRRGDAPTAIAGAIRSDDRPDRPRTPRGARSLVSHLPGLVEIRPLFTRTSSKLGKAALDSRCISPRRIACETSGTARTRPTNWTT